MKLAAEFDEINGRFQPINDMLNVCRERARAANDTDYLALLKAVQALSNELRDLERSLLLDLQRNLLLDDEEQAA